MTSIGSMLGGAFGLLRDHPLSVLVWVLLHVAGFALLLLAIQPLFALYSDFLTSQLALGPNHKLDPQALQPFIARMQATGGIVFLAELGLFALLMVLLTATQRAVLRPEERGFCYLRLGGDELRQIALGFILIVGFYVGMFVAILVFGIVIAIIAATSGSAGLVALLAFLAFILLIAAAIYGMVRFSLAFPMTFVRREFAFGEGWRASKGRFWTLFGAYFVIALFQQVLMSIVMSFVFFSVFANVVPAENNPEAAQLAVQHLFEQFLGPAGAALWLGMGAIGGLGITLFGGAMAAAVRDLVAVENAPTGPATLGR